MKPELVVLPRLQTMVTKDGMPVILSQVVSQIIPANDVLTVIHPTTNDPVLVSKELGTVAIWFKF